VVVVHPPDGRLETVAFDAEAVRRLNPQDVAVAVQQGLPRRVEAVLCDEPVAARFFVELVEAVGDGDLETGSEDPTPSPLPVAYLLEIT
jgi:hypothetical protein